ncbi:helix-turn-helix domain-containing protein [Peribacillus asahii]|uniref:helix-turn-helix domain-containing protein n=1 Tax=Peribacillus asahii TaxID=228899 RepID=UPI002079F0EC|nr:helix-turn-helix transcriptional regulator [Peribacillus asahii]USK71729.1 helix-turn-helix domain-containing protein [Peribacillus asahii]
MGSLGNRLKSLREKRNISQKELSKKLEISNVQLSRYESDERRPDYETLKKLSDFFNVSTDYLIAGKEHTSNVSVAGQEISLTQEELKIFEELKKHPILFHDLISNPEAKVKELLKLQKMKKLFEEDDEDHGNGFGELDD